MLRQWIVACALACVAMPAAAQSPQRGVKRGMTVELSGGFANTEFNSNQGFPNANGFYASLGINVTQWLQVYGSSSVQYASVFNGNTRLFGDHIGARFYYRPRYFKINPFGEVLAGASRLDLNVTTPPQKFSDHGFSFKVGGGLDLNLDSHWAVRAINVDYYRTPFFQLHQNNIWIAAGIIFKFGERRYP